MKRVCIVNLSISHYLIFTHGSKTQTKLGYLSLLEELRLQGDSIQNVIHRARLQRVLCMILLLGLWNHHVKASKPSC